MCPSGTQEMQSLTRSEWHFRSWSDKSLLVAMVKYEWREWLIIPVYRYRAFDLIPTLANEGHQGEGKQPYSSSVTCCSCVFLGKMVQFDIPIGIQQRQGSFWCPSEHLVTQSHHSPMASCEDVTWIAFSADSLLWVTQIHLQFNLLQNASSSLSIILDSLQPFYDFYV